MKLRHLFSSLIFPVLVVWYSIWKHLATHRNLQLFLVSFTVLLASGFLATVTPQPFRQSHPLESVVVSVAYVLALTGLISILQSVKTKNWLLLTMGFLTVLIAWQILETLYKTYG